jgi:DNA-binding transcriptional MerR regulator
MSARHEAAIEPLPPIPAKRYFTIGEVSELCGVKPHVLRYWEQEFSQLRPMKRRGNRRYYQHHEVLLVRRIRQLLYEEGFTINGARNRLGDSAAGLARQRNGDPSPSAMRSQTEDLAALAELERAVPSSAPVQQVLELDPVPVAPESAAGVNLREARMHLEAALQLLSLD